MDKTVGIDLTGKTGNGWGVSLDGPHQDRMRERLAKVEASARDKIFHTAARILGQCPSPLAGPATVTGLALGKVQSGKTSSFITLSAQGFDNGFKVVIVLAGTKNNLLSQNTERIRADLANGRQMDLTVLTTESANPTFTQEKLLQLVRVKRPVIVTVLKHHQHIANVAKDFSHLGLSGLPVLVIDDEGDQASPSAKPPTRPSRKAKAPGADDRTATNREIVNLRATLKHHAYIAYTATPQANLLMTTISELSPDFCVLIEPGPGYTGGSTFHGEYQDLFVRAVDEEDIFDEYSGTPESFEEAMATFFVGAAIRKLRGDDDFHSMLVHTSHRQRDHEVVMSAVKALQASWEEGLQLPELDPTHVAVLAILQKGYEDLRDTVGAIPSWSEVAARLPKEVQECEITMVNSSEQGTVLKPEDYLFHNNIFVGGNMLDRGVTVPGLAVTYITRWAKLNQADTVEQRARWFGYKEKYLDVCRIFAPQAILDGFAALLFHEDDLWESLKRWESTGQSVKDWPRLLVLNDPSLQPTRRQVANFGDMPLGDWMVQFRPAADPPVAAANMDVVRSFFQTVGVTNSHFSGRLHKLTEGVPRAILQEQLLNRLVQVDPNFSGATLSELFARLEKDVKDLKEKKIIKGLDLSAFDVIWLEQYEERDGRHQTRRRVLRNGTLPSLLQGHSKKYKGDRNLVEDLTRPVIQIHTPILTDNETGHDLFQAVLLAIYLPGLSHSPVRVVRGRD